MINLKQLSKRTSKPTAFFYPSSGTDFKPNVFLTEWNINRLKEQYKEFCKPELFIYSCRGSQITKFIEELSTGKILLFDDGQTKIIVKQFQDFEYNMLNAYFLEIEVSGENYTEKQNILYFKNDNLDVFEKIILSGLFDVQYLCVYREGSRFKSIIDHIYSSKNCFINQGFKPKFNFLFRDFRDDLFKKIVMNSPAISLKSNYANYIPEYGNMDGDKFRLLTYYKQMATIYKLNYQ